MSHPNLHPCTHGEFYSKLHWIWIKSKSYCIYYTPIDLEQQTDTVRLLFQINRKMVNTIWFLLDFKKISLCAVVHSLRFGWDIINSFNQTYKVNRHIITKEKKIQSNNEQLNLYGIKLHTSQNDHKLSSHYSFWDTKFHAQNLTH